MRALHLHTVHFVAVRHCTTTTWNFLVLHFTEDRLDCKTVRIFAYSSTCEQSNKRSGTRLKTESETCVIYLYLNLILLKHSFVCSPWTRTNTKSFWFSVNFLFVLLMYQHRFTPRRLSTWWWIQFPCASGRVCQGKQSLRQWAVIIIDCFFFVYIYPRSIRSLEVLLISRSVVMLPRKWGRAKGDSSRPIQWAAKRGKTPFHAILNDAGQTAVNFLPS